MATSKAFKTKASSTRGKHNLPSKAGTAMLGNAFFYGIPSTVPYNPRLRQLMQKNAITQTAKVIVLKVNSNLDKVATEPLNHKALTAKNMFAKYRKNH